MDLQDGIYRFISNAPPAHYVVKIQSFSLLTKNSIERYESGPFEAGGYKWKLVLYPSGNTSKNVKDHISLYLALDGARSFSPDWEIYVNLRLFMLDQNNNNYLGVHDTLRKERRFDKMNVESGFDQFIPLKDFNDGSKGYLVDDNCVFGAEVFISKERTTSKGELLAMKKDAITYKHRWRINNYSKLISEYFVSEPFSTGSYNWIMKLYPKGKGAGLGSGYFSLFIAIANPTILLPRSKIHAKIILRVVDQTNQKWTPTGEGNYWISASSGEVGYPMFIMNNTLVNRFLVYDSCSLEAEIIILGVVSALF